MIHDPHIQISSVACICTEPPDLTVTTTTFLSKTFGVSASFAFLKADFFFLPRSCFQNCIVSDWMEHI